jgi:PKD repeat protein
MHRILFLLLGAVAIAGTTIPVRAQYMYLDSNGDGIHTNADALNPNGTPTSVDVWIRTDTNRDGSPAVCNIDPAVSLTIQGYAINLVAFGGTVTYGGFVNQQPAWSTALGAINTDGVHYKNGFIGTIASSPGTYRLASLSITGQSGSPVIQIVDIATMIADFTGFVTRCEGHALDGFYKLEGPSTSAYQGSADWFDADGLGSIEVDPPPVLSPIGDKTVDEGALLSFQAVASDASGAPLSFSLSPGAPAGASITPEGLFTWTPAEAQGPSSYSMTVIVSNGTSLDLETIQVWVNEVNTAPILDPIGNKTVNQGSQLFVRFSATDTDLPGSLFPTQLTYSLGADAPGGMFLSGGSVWWVPTGAGSFPVTIIVTDNGSPPLSDSETFIVTVLPFDGTPVLNSIGNRTVNEGSRLTIHATATDPAGDLLGFEAAPGAPEGFFGNPNGDFFWTPGESMGPGTYSVTIVVTDGALTDSETIEITVLEVNLPPNWVQPADMTVNTGTTATQQLSAFDNDIPANTVTVTKIGGPAFVSVTEGGLVTVSPAGGDAGTHTVSVRAFDGTEGTVSSFQVTILHVNQTPIADAGGPYSGFVNGYINFDGSGSTDPDGEPLSYSWNFGDGATGTGPAASHAYIGGGVHQVVLRVEDEGSLFDTDTTTATVVNSFPATVFATGGNNTLRLGSGKPHLCLQIESSTGAFSATDVDPSSIRLLLDSRGIVAAEDKSTGEMDRNRNGTLEITGCFTKTDLRSLFSGRPTGDYEVVVDGNISTGGRFVGTTTLHVVSDGSLRSASISPNPLNPTAVLTFVTTSHGRVRVDLFDVQGRSLRTLLDEQIARAGYHDVEIDGYDESGNRLASGIYYVQIRSVDGQITKAMTILK